MFANAGLAYTILGVYLSDLEHFMFEVQNKGMCTLQGCKFYNLNYQNGSSGNYYPLDVYVYVTN